MKHLQSPSRPAFGKLAQQYCRQALPLQVMQSAAGFYIGTEDAEGPVSRESWEYFRTRTAAESAYASGAWTQRQQP